MKIIIISLSRDRKPKYPVRVNQVSPHQRDINMIKQSVHGSVHDRFGPCQRMVQPMQTDGSAHFTEICISIAVRVNQVSPHQRHINMVKQSVHGSVHDGFGPCQRMVQPMQTDGSAHFTEICISIDFTASVGILRIVISAHAIYRWCDFIKKEIMIVHRYMRTQSNANINKII